MISFLKRFFSSQSPTTIDIQPKTKEFKFLIAGKYEQIPQNSWYRRMNWKDTHFLRMESDWDKDWKKLSTEEPVVGVSKEDRVRKFSILGDQADFRIYLEREPSNRYDKNAIKVMGSATVNGEYITEQLGYLSKETAELLKDEMEFPHFCRQL